MSMQSVQIIPCLTLKAPLNHESTYQNNRYFDHKTNEKLDSSEKKVQ